MKGTLRLFLTLCIAMLSMTLVQAQERTYSGTVKSAADGQVIIGANVTVVGTTQGTSTGVDGSYSIKARVGSQLSFSYLGMKTQTVTVGNATTIDITLESDATNLEDIVVVAFGTAKKKDLTGSMSSIDSEIISQQANISVSRALEGAIPGVQLSTSMWGGQPGEDQKIIIRGLGTANIDNAGALIVIDGVVAGHANALTTLNPRDIETMNVLKDAASTSLYGSRGANGVVLITTKKGKLGKAKVSFEGKWGVNKVGSTYDIVDNPGTYYEQAWLSHYNFARYFDSNMSNTHSTNVKNPNMSHEEAARFASENLFKSVNKTDLLRNWNHYSIPNGEYLVGLDGKLNPNAQLLWYDNWMDELFYNSFRQEYNVNVSGATEKTDYYISAGYQSDPSFIKNSSFDRYSVRSNINTQITKWLKAGLNMSYTRREREQPNTRYGANAGGSAENLFYWVYGQHPLSAVYARNLDGSYKLDEDGNRIYDLGSGQTDSPYGETSRGGAGRNPAFFMNADEWSQTYDDLSARGYVRATFLKDFTFEANMGLDNTYGFLKRYQNKIQAPFNNSTQGTLQHRFENFMSLSSQQLLTWNRDFNKHHVDVLLGHEYYQEKSRNLQHSRYLSLVDGMSEMGNFVGDGTGGSTYGGNNGGLDRYALEGYFARANYNYDNKYYLSASVRADGSSKFIDATKRWGTFWSVSGAWRISAESWMQDATWVNDLKIRASYGTMGNQNGVGRYAGYNIWGLGNSGNLMNPILSLSFSSYGNPNLSWEKVATFDAGIDFRFWDRFYGSLDFYVRNTTDMIWNRPVAISLGVSSLTENSAGMRNTGFEFDLGVDIIRNEDWLWSFNVNGFTNSNKLTSLPEGVGSEELNGDFEAAYGGGTFYLRGIGKDYYNIYLYKYAGIDQNTGLALYQTTVTEENQSYFPNAQIGDEVTTTNYNLAHRYEMGSATPDLIGGFGTSLRWKNLDFSAQFAFQIGGKYLNKQLCDTFYASGNFGGAPMLKEIVGNTWTPENTGAEFPIQMTGMNGYYRGTSVGSWAYSDQSLLDASYLSVKNLTLGYSFPQKWMDRWGIGGIRVYASLDNMWLISAKQGFDPRFDLQGGQNIGTYQYPQIRSMSLGINVTF